MYAHVAKYDKAAGHFIQPEKTSMAATNDGDQRTIKSIELDGHKPKVKDHDVPSGDIVTTSRRRLRQGANDKIYKPCEMSLRLNGTMTSRRTKLRAATVAIVPTAISDNQWCRASTNVANKLRTTLMKGTFGPGRNLRCIEILTSLFYDPAKLDLTSRRYTAL